MFHPFYVKNEDGTGQWKAASNLEAGEELLTEDGKKVFVSEVRVEKLEEGELRREGSGKSTIYVRLK